MTTVSEVRDPIQAVLHEQNDILTQEQAPERGATQIPDHLIAGETENMAKAQEALQRATSPNLQNLQKEQALQDQIKAAKTAEEKFAVTVELFKFKVENLKKAGLSIHDLTTQVEDQFLKLLNSKMPVYPYKLFEYLEATFKFIKEYHFEGENADLKNSLLDTYKDLLNLGNDRVELAKLNFFYPSSPCIQVFELENTTGISVLGTLLLLKECFFLFEIISKISKKTNLITRMRFIKNFKKLASMQLPRILQTVIQFEKGPYKKICALLINFYLNLATIETFSSHFGIFLHCLKETQSPFTTHIQLFEKCAHPNLIQKYLDQQSYYLKTAQEAYEWIDHLCQIAETLAISLPERAQFYLQMAETERKNKLWAYPFSCNKKIIEQKQQEALERITKAKNKILEGKSS